MHGEVSLGGDCRERGAGFTEAGLALVAPAVARLRRLDGQPAAVLRDDVLEAVLDQRTTFRGHAIPADGQRVHRSEKVALEKPYDIFISLLIFSYSDIQPAFNREKSYFALLET